MKPAFDQARSSALFERARRVMPGGNTRTTVFAVPHPTYLARGFGERVEDVDGNLYLDFDNNFTSLIHGHGFPLVVEALQRQAALGTCFGAPTRLEVAFAELLCERVPHFDHVRFMNTGTEAVMNAVKAARALTGRSKIAKVEGAYHGSYDFVQVSLSSSPETWGSDLPLPVAFDAGTPRSVLGETVVIPFNDVVAAERILPEHAGELAGILIDPLPSRVGLLPVAEDFISYLRAFTQQHGIVLISDEVLSFRLSLKGAMPIFEVEPDLCAFGKIIGGGLPIGAVGGRSRFMAVFDPSNGKPPVSQAGTFTANPMTMAAGLATMQAFTSEACGRLNQLGGYAREGLRRAFEQAGVAGQVTGMGSLFRLHLKASPIRNYRDAYPTPMERAQLAALVAFLRNQGVIISPIGLGALSTPMTRADIDQLIELVRLGLEVTRQAAS